MKKGILVLSACVFLLFAGAATAGPVEVNGGLHVTGTSGTDGITFPDDTKQTTAATGTVTSVGTGGGLTGGPITTTGTISIAPGGVIDSMLATGISGSKISGNISGYASGLTTPLSISQGGTGATTAATAFANMSPKAPVLNSGQLITYATGDDGNFKYGAVVTGSRFTDNGNGTVTDNLTSLIWLKNANCFSAVTWIAAVSDTNGLANGGCSGGLTDGSVAGDWRLPNLNELESLIDASNYTPALPTGHPFLTVQSDGYWSSTTYAPNTALAWGVGMVFGVVVGSYKSDSYYVWPVRGGRGKIGLPKTGQTTSYSAGDDGTVQKGVAWPSPRFTDNGNGTVTDNLTGLIWLKNANCFGAVAWTTSLDDANTLAAPACSLSDGSVAGDWRLPTRRELRTLVDYSQQAPSLPAGNPFTSVQSYDYWSSTTFVDTPSAWSVSMLDGYVYHNTKIASYYVWPVRGGQ